MIEARIEKYEAVVVSIPYVDFLGTGEVKPTIEVEVRRDPVYKITEME